MTLIIGLALFAVAVILFGYSLARVSAAADRKAQRAHQDYVLRYKGGRKGECRICGEPVDPNYEDNHGPIHAYCRSVA